VPLRRRLCDSDCQIDFSVLQQFKAESGTDYIAIPMVRSDGETNAITFDTDLGNGFTASEIAGRTAGLSPHCQKPVGFVVTSASFVAAARQHLESLHFYQLRGVAEPQELFSPTQQWLTSANEQSQLFGRA
jgi:hypothetical protein